MNTENTTLAAPGAYLQHAIKLAQRIPLEDAQTSELRFTLTKLTEALDAPDALRQSLGALLSIGSAALADEVILINVQNLQRRAACLWAIEHTFFMVPVPADEDEDDTEPGEECALNWGAEPAEYVEQFRAALAAQQPAADPLWCIHIPGPDDLHAAPSNEEAVKAAAAYNAHMRAYWEKRTTGLTPQQIDCYPALASCLAHVVPWPWDAAGHAESVKEWKLVDWLPKQPAASGDPAAQQCDAKALLDKQAAESWDVRAESGDDDVHFVVIEHHMSEPKERAIGHGITPADALRDAMLPPGDPRRWDYVPASTTAAPR